MSLTDVMSHAGYVGYAVVAMVLFVLAFLLIAMRTFAPGRSRDMEESSRLPLHDGADEGATR